MKKIKKVSELQNIPVGKSVMFHNDVIKVVKSHGCQGCYFDSNDLCVATKCSSYYRKDGNDVYFLKMNKVDKGETFVIARNGLGLKMCECVLNNYGFKLAQEKCSGKNHVSLPYIVVDQENKEYYYTRIAVHIKTVLSVSEFLNMSHEILDSNRKVFIMIISIMSVIIWSLSFILIPKYAAAIFMILLGVNLTGFLKPLRQWFSKLN